MTAIMIIVAIAVAFYAYGAIAYYYGFKNFPFCGCKGKECSPKK